MTGPVAITAPTSRSRSATSSGGEDFDFPKTYVANGDDVGVELRRGFLWYEPTDGSLLRVGILDWHDRFGERPRFDDAESSHWAVDAYDSERAPLANSVWDFSVGGVTYDFEAKDVWHGSLGAMVLSQGDTLGGDGSALLFASDLDREVGASLYGVSAYYLRDRGGYSYGDFGGPSSGSPIERSWDFWLGARGHHDFLGVRPSYFFIWNRGATESPEWRHSGWAVKGALDYAFGSTVVSFQSYYSTGSDGSSRERSGEFRTIAQSTRDGLGAASYWSFLGLSSARGPSDVADLGVSLQNLGLGLRTVQASLRHSWNERFSSYLAFGGLSSAQPRPRSGSRSMGVELLGEASWRLAGAMVLDVGGAYFWTGDFYRRGPATDSPANLYEIYARFQLELAVLAGN